MLRHTSRLMARGLACLAADPGASTYLPLMALSLTKTQTLRPGWSGWQGFSTEGTDLAQTSTDTADKLNEMIELMMKDPAMQQLLMSRLPPHMRKPEVLRAMMANPEVKQRISGMARSAGLDKVWSTMGASKLAAGMEASRAAGMEPASIYSKFMDNPKLGQHLQNPRVLAALMDCCSNGPEALKKYEGDKEVLDAYMEAADIIQQSQQGAIQAGPPSGSSSSSSTPSMADDAMAQQLQQQLGVNPEQLMQKLMARPDLISKVQDPEVQAALAEIAASPWKVVKYVFNRKVMSAIKDMKDILQTPPGAAP